MKRTKIHSLITLSLILLASCAKDRPYDVEYIEEKQFLKNEIVVEERRLDSKGNFILDENGQPKMFPVEYIYVPSSLGTPMEVADAAPFVQGQEKLVTLKWEESGLGVYEKERDERFNSNDLNSTPVLNIPGKYYSYRCKEDAYGDCTNVEEENKELEWYEKSQFRPDFEEMEVTEVNTLDASLVDWSGCLSASRSKLVNYEITSGVINVELQRTYTVNKANPICTITGAYAKDSAESSFDVRYFYSLVRLDKLADKNYEPIEYPVPDHNDFGFFKNEELVLADNYDRARPDRKILMNRWNPNRKNGELVYYLSPEFSKEENKVVLDATYEAISVMNSEMTAAQIPFTIKLIEQKDKSKAVSPGDIRYNSIVLIEDPLANGLLGYGPSVKNPYTGEIIQAHTNMYLGVLKSMTRRVYESASDLTEEEHEALQPQNKELKGFTVAKSALPKSLPEVIINSYENTSVIEDTEPTRGTNPIGTAFNIPVESIPTDIDSTIGDSQGFQKELPAELLNENRVVIEAQMKEELHRHTIHKASDISIDQIIAKLKSSSSVEFNEVDEANLIQEKKWNFLAKNNAFSEDFFPIAGTSKVVYPELREVTGILTEKGTLKRWDNLTNTQREKVQNIILKNSYKATLIHELGHNLGLKHNFMGSHDHENFLTEEEAKGLGLDAAPAYSSIMDYSFSEFNQLKAFGKYDIAALRFGYKREVELSNGQFMKVTGSLHEAQSQLAASQEGVPIAQALKVKRYEYCSDENTNLGNLCNRFDEGTTLQEIIKHRIKKYKDSYKYRNLRDGRLKYNTYGMQSYIYARNAELGRIRDIIEDRENSREFWKGYLPKLLESHNVSLSEEELDFVLDGGCTAKFGEKTWFCKDYIDDARIAVEIAGEFFLELIKTPDHICALVKENNPTQVVEYRKLADIYNQIKGEIDTVPTSCFDEVVKSHVESELLFVAGENGKFLNGFKDANPNFKYTQDRFARGIWPDKIYAMRYLFKRKSNFSTTDDSFSAIIDNPNIIQKAVSVFRHLTNGEQLDSPIAFKTESGQTFQIPYVIGEEDEVEQLEDKFSDLAATLRMSPSGKTNLTKLMLAQIQREHTSYGVGYKDLAYVSRNLLAVKKDAGKVPLDERDTSNQYYYDSRLRVTYSAGRESQFTYHLIKTINSFNFLNSQDKRKVEMALKVINYVDFKVPEGVVFTPEQLAFFQINKEAMLGAIRLSERGVHPDAIKFELILGEELGKLVRELFRQGTEALQNIYDMKTDIYNKIVDEASEDELRLLQTENRILDKFLNGEITPELIRFYKKKLTMLPSFAPHQDSY